MAKKPEKFGKYILLEKLASGGMAEVYLAKSIGYSGVSKFLAIKRILPQFSDKLYFIDMFKKEAKIAINLNHSNIVSIYDFGVESDQFYLVMDFVDGKNLRQLLNKIKKAKHGLAVEHIAYIVKEVASGLDHAHRCLDASSGRPLNITHRDISPQNVMVSFEGEIKVVDFGIAKAESELENTRTDTLKGKFSYMSPEQASGQNVDLRTDIFSLGIVLWELLADDRLFVANNEINTLRKVTDCKIPSLRNINPNIPSELEQIVYKALAKDRSLRYQTAAALHRDLNRFLNRNFPDFSAQDFSTFIKKHFTEEILTNRKKLVKYSQIDIEPPKQKKVITPRPSVDEDDETETRGRAENLDRTEVSQDPNSQNSIPEIEEAQPSNDVDEASFSQAIASLRKSHHTHVQQERSVTTPSMVYTPSRGRTSSSSRTSVTRVRQQKKPSRIFQGLLAIFLGFAGYIGYETWLHSKQQGQQELASTNRKQQIADSKPPGNVARSPNRKVDNLIIRSQPSSARIFINGKDTGEITPAQIQVPHNQAFSLRLIAEGYYPLVKQLISREPTGTYQAELKRLQTAFLNIIVIPNIGEVYVNDVRVPSNQTNRYPIPAGVPVEVVARSSVTGDTVKKTVRVAKDRVRKVKLTLGGNSR